MEHAGQAGELGPHRQASNPEYGQASRVVDLTAPAAAGVSAVRDAAAPGTVVIRPFDGIGDHEQCARLQGRIWGQPNAVASSMTVAIQRHGGIAIGAFDRQGRLLGFVLSFLAPSTIPGAARGLSHHSHMAGVAPEWQNRGIGSALKLAQREAVLAQGLNLITWTYDPLEARNAVLNIRKLRAVCRLYHRDYYGEMRDTLNSGVASDRFEVEWWLDRAPFSLPHNAPRLEINVPPDFQSIKRADINLARAWRMRTRLQFEEAFARGFVASDFAARGDRTAYILTRVSDAGGALARRA